MLRVVLSNASYGLLAPVLLYKNSEKPYFVSEKNQLFKKPVYASLKNENNDQKERASKENEKKLIDLQKLKILKITLFSKFFDCN